MITIDTFVKLEPKQHVYTNETGLMYDSVSSILRMIKEPFDVESISYMVARKQLREEAVPGWKEKGLEAPDIPENFIKARQEKVKEEWSDIGEESRDHGTEIHNAIERIILGQEVEERFDTLVPLIKAEFGHYRFSFPELTVYNKVYRKAGTIDHVGIRQKSKNTLVDIDDFKTNVRNGVRFDSTKLQDNGRLKHYNRMLLPPVDHLEDCNYIMTCLQTSFYAYFFETLYKMKIGKLSMKYVYEIGGVFQLESYPLVYLRSDVINILNVLYQEEKSVEIDPDDY